MISLNATAHFPKRTNTPVFAGGNTTPDRVATPPLQNKAIDHAQEEWRKQLEVKRNEQAAAERLLEDWKDFSQKKFSEKSDNIQMAIDKMTSALEGKIKLKKMHTNGTLTAGIAKGYVEAEKDPNAPKFIKMG